MIINYETEWKVQIISFFEVLPYSEVCHPLRCAIPVVCLNYMVR